MKTVRRLKLLTCYQSANMVDLLVHILQLEYSSRCWEGAATSRHFAEGISSVLNAHVSYSYDSNPNPLCGLIVTVTQVTAMTVSYDVWKSLCPVTISSLTGGGGSAAVRLIEVRGLMYVYRMTPVIDMRVIGLLFRSIRLLEGAVQPQRRYTATL